jgi:hypothetical protein
MGDENLAAFFDERDEPTWRQTLLFHREGSIVGSDLVLHDLPDGALFPMHGTNRS